MPAIKKCISLRANKHWNSDITLKPFKGVVTTRLCFLRLMAQYAVLHLIGRNMLSQSQTTGLKPIRYPALNRLSVYIAPKLKSKFMFEF